MQHKLAAPAPAPAPGAHLVTSLQGSGGPNLELPLAGHDLGVDAADDQASLQAEAEGKVGVGGEGEGRGEAAQAG